MIPTSIDGTDITGATIDGTDVQEITVDGDVVFSGGPSNLPLAYSNLVAWYPFDSATYGGSNADDVTAIIGGSGDDTAYDGTVNGASYQSSNGVTDINAGANSGAYDFDGSNDAIAITNPMDNFNEITFCFWIEPDGQTDSAPFIFSDNNVAEAHIKDNSDMRWIFDEDGSGGTFDDQNVVSLNGGYQWFGFTIDSSQNGQAYHDGQPTTSFTSVPILDGTGNMLLGDRSSSNRPYEGRIDDFRIYNTDLSNSQMQQIYDNTN